MRKILVVVENQMFVGIIRNFLRYLRLPVRVHKLAQERLIFRKKGPGLIIVDAHKRAAQWPTLIDRVRSRFGKVTVICFTDSKNSRLRKLMGGRKGVAYMTRDESLLRLRSLIKQLRRRRRVRT